ncbi:MAG: hypothetical protein MJZ04_11420 [Bacteroidales bacterium]|nr:hypothetical protein [Bacteroidales bacterium]
MNRPVMMPARHMVHCITTATHPEVYAMEPQTTKVPAEKMLMKRDRPDIHHGSVPPAEKKLREPVPRRKDAMPANSTTMANITSDM